VGRALRTDVPLAEGTWEAVAALVMLRPWDGRCERCGLDRPAHPHHRVLKAQGGLDVPSNIAALCEKCHRYVHEHPLEAGGWIVQAPWDFRGTAIRMHDGRVARLTDDYGYDILEWAA
jgi:5-methylcytosine-specific restriction endonuclease McrA